MKAKNQMFTYLYCLGIFFILAKPSLCQDSIAIHRFPSLHGSTGVFKTTDAFTAGKLKGTISLFENVRYDSLDQLVFNFGVHDQLDVGLQSGIPSHDPTVNFVFKFRGTNQGNFFGFKHKLLPATAIGFNRQSTYAAASYYLTNWASTIGYHFSDGKQSLFANLSYHHKSGLAIQIEYLKNHFGSAIRFKHRQFTGGIFTAFELDKGRFEASKTYWSIGFDF